MLISRFGTWKDIRLTEPRRRSCLLRGWLMGVNDCHCQGESDGNWCSGIPVRDMLDSEAQLRCVVGTLEVISTPDRRLSRPIVDSGAPGGPATV
jgi:hypothetical protein